MVEKMTKQRRRYSSKFKLKAVLAVLKGDKTAAQLAGELEVHAMALSGWKQQFLSSAHEVFDKKRKKGKDPEEEKAELFEEIGRLKMELEWLKKNLSQSLGDKRALINRENSNISVARQCELLGIHRSGIYYRPKRLSDEDLLLKRLIDEQFHLSRF